MAPAPRYATPAAQMVELARQARDEGLTFDEWWDQAVHPSRIITTATPDHECPYGAVLWPSDRGARVMWMDVTLAVREGWQRAYEAQQPTRAEVALTRMDGVFDSLPQPVLTG